MKTALSNFVDNWASRVFSKRIISGLLEEHFASLRQSSSVFFREIKLTQRVYSQI